jgi:hypothetical protein
VKKLGVGYADKYKKYEGVQSYTMEFDCGFGLIRPFQNESTDLRLVLSSFIDKFFGGFEQGVKK